MENDTFLDNTDTLTHRITIHLKHDIYEQQAVILNTSGSQPFLAYYSENKRDNYTIEVFFEKQRYEKNKRKTFNFHKLFTG